MICYFAWQDHRIALDVMSLTRPIWIAVPKEQRVLHRSLAITIDNLAEYFKGCYSQWKREDCTLLMDKGAAVAIASCQELQDFLAESAKCRHLIGPMYNFSGWTLPERYESIHIVIVR